MLIQLQRVHQLDFNKEMFISRMHGANIKIVLNVSDIIITHLQEHETTVTTTSGNR